MPEGLCYFCDIRQGREMEWVRGAEAEAEGKDKKEKEKEKKEVQEGQKEKKD